MEEGSFCLGADMKNVFDWAESEKEAGRTVHMPPVLMNHIMTKREEEHKQ